MTEQHIIIAGNPVEGFRYEGPFPSFDDAVASADKEQGTDWWVAPLHTPAARADVDDDIKTHLRDLYPNETPGVFTVADEGLTLVHEGGSWDGTFMVVLAALVKDLISDEAPFGAIVHAEADTSTVVRYEGQISGYDDATNEIIFLDNVKVPAGHVLAIAVL